MIVDPGQSWPRFRRLSTCSIGPTRRVVFDSQSRRSPVCSRRSSSVSRAARARPRVHPSASASWSRVTGAGTHRPPALPRCTWWRWVSVSSPGRGHRHAAGSEPFGEGPARALFGIAFGHSATKAPPPDPDEGADFTLQHQGLIELRTGGAQLQLTEDVRYSLMLEHHPVWPILRPSQEATPLPLRWADASRSHRCRSTPPRHHCHSVRQSLPISCGIPLPFSCGSTDPVGAGQVRLGGPVDRPGGDGAAVLRERRHGEPPYAGITRSGSCGRRHRRSRWTSRPLSPLLARAPAWCAVVVRPGC